MKRKGSEGFEKGRLNNVILHVGEGRKEKILDVIYQTRETVFHPTDFLLKTQECRGFRDYVFYCIVLNRLVVTLYLFFSVYGMILDLSCCHKSFFKMYSSITKRISYSSKTRRF